MGDPASMPPDHAPNAKMRLDPHIYIYIMSFFCDFVDFLGDPSETPDLEAMAMPHR